MLGRGVLFVAVVLLIVALCLFIADNLSKRSQRKTDLTTQKARGITFQRTLCADVDKYIVDTELDGQQTPLALLQARLEVDDAPNDETRAYALARLEKEFHTTKKRK